MQEAWELLFRADCSLCEDMQAELLALLGPQAHRVRLVDIEGSPELERRYGTRIPVLLIDGELVCAHRLDKERLRPYLATNS